MSILSTIQQEVERSIYESIRLILVEHGYLPDITTFTDDKPGKQAYDQAVKDIVTAQGFCVELFGASAPPKKYEKKVPRIVILPKRHIPGDLGGGPDALYEEVSPGVFNKLQQSDRTTEYQFEISIVSGSSAQDRLMNSVLKVAVPSRGYINFVDSQPSGQPTNFYVEQFSFRDSPDTEDGINEKFYLYRALDLYERPEQVISTNISSINTINVDIIEDNQQANNLGDITLP